MKVTITNYGSSGEQKFPHGLEAQLLATRTDKGTGFMNALGYVEAKRGKETTRIVVPLFNTGTMMNDGEEQPWILTDWFSFPDGMPASVVDHWVDMLVLRS